MKDLYARFSTYSLWLGICTLIASPIILILTYKDFFSTYELFSTSLLVIIFAFIGYFFFKNVSRKLPQEQNVLISDEFPLNEFIFQSDISFISRVYLVSNTGQKMYMVEPTKQKPISRLLTFFSLVSTGLIIPITFDVMTLDRSTVVFSFTVTNNWKQFNIRIHDEIGRLIGEYQQPMLKSALRNKGILLNARSETWREIEAKNMAGDIDILDKNQRITASYRFGRFPYAMHPAFQAIPDNKHIKLGDHVADDERKAYLAIFYFWLMMNNK